MESSYCVNTPLPDFLLSISQLIYNDLENAEKRAEVLDHIAREGRQYKNERRANEVYYRRGSADSKLKSVRTLGNIAELRRYRCPWV